MRATMITAAMATMATVDTETDHAFSFLPPARENLVVDV
jgi:hypothetical protein